MDRLIMNGHGTMSHAGEVRTFDPLSPDERHRFHAGTHARAYRQMGAHLVEHEGVPGAGFAVWAPGAAEVSVMGDFNGWSKTAHRLGTHQPPGIWTGFIPGLDRGTAYKYHIISRHGEFRVDKADPFAIRQQTEPGTASEVWDPGYAWSDGDWMRTRAGRQSLDGPMSIYEVHLGSWRRVPEEGNRWLTYRESASLLARYAQQMGFTHVELLPIMSHPFYGSWGYQATGFFAPTGRYGSPQDLMSFIDVLHQHGLGVILDWVPSHFPDDEHGLVYFDGTPLYEPEDQRQRLHPDWNSCLFNYGRPEVRSFLLSSALFWLEHYHADGLRMDAVASMLYLDFSRRPGEWTPNRFGGRENLEAIDFLRLCNETIYREYPDVQTFAEESAAWPQVSRPTYIGGLGFGFKWDMGFMHDTMEYFRKDPVHRKFHHQNLTFRATYAFAENFLLPLSHDEVVYGKGSLLSRMPGDDFEKFAGLRLLLAYMHLQPGKKLLFMGAEFGQCREWNHDMSLDWHLIQDGNPHNGLQKLVGTLNRLHRTEPALHQNDVRAEGFQWIDCHDVEHSTLTWLRLASDRSRPLLILCNFTPVTRRNFRVGVPRGGFWRELLNTDALDYGGRGEGNMGGMEAAPVPWHGQRHTMVVTLPPLAALVFQPE
jgi:1,4-alpha-glucan branching enzyme